MAFSSTGTWRVTKPEGSEPIRDHAIWLPDNFQYIEDWFEVEHVWPGSTGETAGHHRPGSCRVLKYAASANLASMTAMPDGAVAYVTDKYRFVYSESAVWTTFENLLHTQGGSMTGDLSVIGSSLDGRTPSADGARLDTMSTGADTVGIASVYFTEASVSGQHGDNIGVPSTPTGVTFATTDCKYLAVQASSGTGQSCSTKISATGGITTETMANVFCIGVK